MFLSERRSFSNFYLFIYFYKNQIFDCLFSHTMSANSYNAKLKYFDNTKFECYLYHDFNLFKK